jgi:hypothetical protein
MHAVIVSVSINDAETAAGFARDQLAPRASQAPGFVAGYWVRLEGDTKGRSTVVFETEDAARAMADQIQPPPDNVATIDSVEVGEVVASA